MELIDFILNVDTHLFEFITNYGSWVYAILFLIIFVETGLVVMPFLPGDSLLFAAGALAASTGALNPVVLIILLFIAAVLGDTLNYHIGKYIGPRVFELESKLINKQHLIATQHFFEKHGGKTITLCRFVPLVRTFAPFVAGVTKMKMFHFQLYNFLGAVLWIIGLTASGYFFGNIPIIRNHLNTIVLLGVGAAVIPVICGGLWKLLRRSIYSR